MGRWFDPSAPLPPSATVAPIEGVYARIFKHMMLFKGGITASIVFAMLSSLFIALQPWPIKFIIDGVLVDDVLDLGPLGEITTVTNDEKLQVAAGLAVAYFIIVVIGVLLNAASFYAIARTALLMIHDLRSRLVRHVRSLSMSYHANQSVGDTIWRAINDARSIQEVMIFGIRTWAVLVFRLLIMLVFMLLLDPLLTARLACRPAAAVLHDPPPHRAHSAHVAGEPRAHEPPDFADRADDERDPRRAGLRARGDGAAPFRRGEHELRARANEVPGIRAGSERRDRRHHGLGTAVVLYVASDRVISGALTVGSLWVFVSYMQALYQMMNEIMFVYGPFQDAVVGVGRVFQVLDQTSDIQEAPDARDKKTFDDSVRFRNVRLAYDGDRDILRGVDFEVARGQKIAIVGETGSGKTSILNMIPRLYDATEGAIEIDGVDIRDLKLADLRDLVSMVPQEPLLFSATVRENILYGRLDASDDEVGAAALAARADGFVQDLPAKYETEVGERGVKLSVGQQQRISIARAFLKDAPILLLDEPTSALDLRTEADFLDGLSDLMAGRTVIIVAHRLSTIRNVDCIYFLENGQFVEEGSHEQLMRSRGRYYSLFMSQFGSGEPEPAVV